MQGNCAKVCRIIVLLNTTIEIRSTLYDYALPMINKTLLWCNRWVSFAPICSPRLSFARCIFPACSFSHSVIFRSFLDSAVGFIFLFRSVLMSIAVNISSVTLSASSARACRWLSLLGGGKWDGCDQLFTRLVRPNKQNRYCSDSEELNSGLSL